MTLVKRSALILGPIVPVWIALVSFGAPAAAWGQQQQRTAFSGKPLYTTYCAMCHGTSGKGDGSFAPSLRKRPADLTQLAKLNQGVFPAERIAKAIDGREPGTSHGGDMPVWGDAFSRTKEDNDPESVRLKIEAIVKFLESLQERTTP